MDLLNTISNHRLWNKYGTQLLWFVAILCLGIAVGRIGLSAYTQSKIKQVNYQSQEVKSLARNKRPSYRINDIVSANLFGDPTPPKKVVVQKAPKTTLDLTLQGILWASEPELARAIIMTGKKNSELYSVGETIKGAGASVKEIRDGEVLLNRNGATESLPLVKKTTSGNRQLITFVTPKSNFDEVASVGTTEKVSRFRANNQQARNNVTSRAARAQKGKPRKIRKPNFSGLDNALKKMGEL